MDEKDARKPTLYIYDPDGRELLCKLRLTSSEHIPQEGELLTQSDHTDGHLDTYDRDDMFRVVEVQTEFRLVDNLNGGESYQQLVYVHTDVIDNG